MANLYTTIAGLQVSPNDVLEAELLSTQILQAAYPNLDLREGTALHDTVIRPAATLLATLKKGTDYYFAQNTIKNINDNSPTDFLDSIMSNWFISRIQGSNSTISARLFFARQVNVVISSSVYFSPDNTLKFYPSANLNYQANQLTFDSNSNEYYVDVILTAAAAGTQYNISSGSLLYFTNFSPYFLHGEINYLASTATDSETNTQFITRAGTAISTRNLVNVPSIISLIQQNFNVTPNIQPIGFGDLEMVRDFVQVTLPGIAGTTWIHNGGMVDVYCRVPLTTTITQVTTDGSGDAIITAPAYAISRSSISGSSIADSIPILQTQAVTSITSSSTTATVTTTSPHGYSTGNSITISGAIQTGYNGTFTITVTGASTFTYTVAAGLVTPATGTILSGIDYPHTFSNPDMYSSVVTLTQTANVVTGTLNNNGFTVGRYVTISGASQSQYNGTYFITAVTQNTFTYTISGNPASPATGTINALIINPTSDFGFSTSQRLKVSFGGGQTNKTASFVLYEFLDLDGIQSFMNDSVNRVLCGNYLARGFNQYLLDVTITAYNGPIPDQTLANSTVLAYIDSLVPGQTFIMGDLTAALNAVGIVSIKTPVLVTYKYYHRDLLPSPMATGTITDYLDPADRTSTFGLNSLITTNAVI